jgi:hypothetical protein
MRRPTSFRADSRKLLIPFAAASGSGGGGGAIGSPNIFGPLSTINTPNWDFTVGHYGQHESHGAVASVANGAVLNDATAPDGSGKAYVFTVTAGVHADDGGDQAAFIEEHIEGFHPAILWIGGYYKSTYPVTGTTQKLLRTHSYVGPVPPANSTYDATILGTFGTNNGGLIWGWDGYRSGAGLELPNVVGGVTAASLGATFYDGSWHKLKIMYDLSVTGQANVKIWIDDVLYWNVNQTATSGGAYTHGWPMYLGNNNFPPPSSGNIRVCGRWASSLDVTGL